MLDNILATADLVSAEEKATPTVPPTEEKTPSKPAESASEGDKTPPEGKDEELRFDKHSRFKELVEEKNKWKQQYESLSPLQEEVKQLKEQISALTGQNTSSMPQFETLEDLTKYISELPQKVKAEILSEQEQSQNHTKEVDEYVQDQLDNLLAQDENLDTDALLAFAVEHEIFNFDTAYKLYKQINASKEEGIKKGEEIGKRKADSGLKSGKTGSTDTALKYRRGQSLEDVFSEAKKFLNP